MSVSITNYQFSITSSQLPVINYQTAEDYQMETGNWKLKTLKRKLKILKMETGNWKMETCKRKLETENWKLKIRDQRERCNV